MELLGIALGWKYNDEPGIRTDAGRLTGWPATLGKRPTLQQQRAIIQEYAAYLEDKEASETAGLAKIRELMDSRNDTLSIEQMKELVALLCAEHLRRHDLRHPRRIVA